MHQVDSNPNCSTFTMCILVHSMLFVHVVFSLDLCVGPDSYSDISPSP